MESEVWLKIRRDMNTIEVIKLGESETTEFKTSLAEWRVPTSFQREDKFEYPIDALREALINALIHRNYDEPADVRVFLFDTHAEIINPGSFPEGVTPKKPVHKPVNPILCCTEKRAYNTKGVYGSQFHFQ